MKITVMDNGMVKVEGSTLAEEVEMRNKLQAQGKTCTPIEYEGSVQGCLDWIMGTSESELDEVEDDDDFDEDEDDYEYEHENTYVFFGKDGQAIIIEIAKVVDFIKEKLDYDLSTFDWSDVESLVEDYLWNYPEITEDDFYYLVEEGQTEKLIDMIYYDNL